MAVSLRLYRHWLILLLLVGLAGCGGIAPIIHHQPAAPLSDQAAAQAAQGHYAAAASLYERAADQAKGNQKPPLLLAGSEAASRAGNGKLANALLKGIDPASLSKQLQDRYKLARVQARIAGKPPQKALALLPAPGGNVPPATAARLWQIRAHLQFQLGHTVKGVHALVQRNVWLVDPDQVKANDYAIWHALKTHPPGSKAHSDDTTTQGWLALARIGAQVWPNRKILTQKLNAWSWRYPGHPAARHILPEQFGYTPSPTMALGNTIGLALPLSGQFAAAGKALLNGFFAGYYNSKKRPAGDVNFPAPKRPDVRIYDTNSIPDTQRLLQQAHADGVHLLIGPLNKQSVGQLAGLKHPGMRILALNYADTNANFAGFYQYGLAPEDEARAVARRALRNNMRLAIALVPQGNWGSRMLDAFTAALTAGGGKLLDYATYDPKKTDYGKPIKRILRHYDHRHPNAPGTADFVFIAAQPGPARLLRTQLRYYHASRLPELATSHVFSGRVDPRRDIDLNGVTFAATPWLMDSTPEVARRRKQIDSLWPNSATRLPRLYAMGYDVWLLSKHLRRGTPDAGPLFIGNTGALYLQDDGQIHRYLGWARFQHGRPKLLTAPAFPTPATTGPTQPILPGAPQRDAPNPAIIGP